MVDEFKNILLAGIGSVAYTYEKASKLVDTMVEKGKITVEEGKDLSKELKRNIQEKADSIKPLTKDDLTTFIKELNFATKDDLTALNYRISKLEEKLNKE